MKFNAILKEENIVTQDPKQVVKSFELYFDNNTSNVMIKDTASGDVFKLSEWARKNISLYKEMLDKIGIFTKDPYSDAKHGDSLKYVIKSFGKFTENPDFKLLADGSLSLNDTRELNSLER